MSRKLSELQTKVSHVPATDYLVGYREGDSLGARWTGAQVIAPHNADAGAHGGIGRYLPDLLRDGARSATLMIVTDSTGLGGANWPAHLVSELAAATPAYNIKTQSWQQYETTEDRWGGSSRIYTAPGGETGIAFFGTATDLLPTRSLIGVLGGEYGWRITLELALSDFSATHRIFSRTDRPTTVAVNMVAVGTDKKVSVFYNTTEDNLFATALTTSAALPVEVNQKFWVRVVFNGNAANTFTVSYSTDGATFTQLGSALAATGKVLDVDLPIWLGGFSGYANMRGTIYDCAIERKTAAGNWMQAFSPNIGEWRPPSAYTPVMPFAYVGAPTLLILIGAAGGYTFKSFVADTWTPRSQFWGVGEVNLVLAGAIHNYYTDPVLGSDFRTWFAGFATYARAAVPSAAVVCFTELPIGTAMGVAIREYSVRKIARYRELCREMCIPVVDSEKYIRSTYTTSEIDAQLNPADGIHWIAGSPAIDVMAAYMIDQLLT